MKLYPLIQALHFKNRNIKPFLSDSNLWPENWKTVEFKEYPRFPSIKLPLPESSTLGFHEVLSARKSTRNFNRKRQVGLQQLSDFLHYGAGIRDEERLPAHSFRFYPSGGARYPLELYLALRGGAGTEQGVYHYNVRNHSLEKLLGPDGERKLRSLPSYPFVQEAWGIGLITAIFDRNMRKYGERGYRFVLYEVGVLIHNLYLAAGATGLSLCAVGSANDSSIEDILDISERDEGFLLQFAFGHTQDTA